MQHAPAPLDLDRREHSRQSVNVPCTVFWKGLYEYATIQNISLYGAQLEGFEFPPVGTSISIQVDRLEVCATIIWCGENRCGVLLAHGLDPAAFIQENGVRPIVTASADPVVVTDILIDQYA
ncbi:PilZ domain-containing protein [Sphingobium sp. AP50]|nr:PilZ domain-containing protein [Sphingobium sp. AP50]